MSEPSPLSRRSFLKLGALGAAGGTILAADIATGGALSKATRAANAPEAQGEVSQKTTFEPEKITELGTEVYGMQNIEEVRAYLRSLDQDIPNPIDVETDAATNIREKREAAREADPYRRFVYVMNDTLWNAVIEEGQKAVGTNDPAEILEAYMYVQNSMLQKAGFPPFIKITSIIHVPDSELTGDQHTYGAETPNNWDPASRNKWTNVQVKSTENPKDGQVTYSPIGCDQMITFSSQTSTDWFLCKNGDTDGGKWVSISEKDYKVRGDMIHESMVHTLMALPDLYSENADVALQVDPNNPNKNKRVFVHSEDNMANAGMFNIGHVSRAFYQANTAHTLNEHFRSTQTDGLVFIKTPYQPPEYEGNEIDTCDGIFPQRSDIVLYDKDGNVVTSQITNAQFFVETNLPGQPLDLQATSADPDLTPNAIRIDQRVVGGPGNEVAPDRFKINVRHMYLEVGNCQLPIPNTVFKMLGVDEKQYANPLRTPVNELHITKDLNTVEMPDTIHVQICRGFVPPVNPDNSEEFHPEMYAYMQLDTQERTFVVWSSSILMPDDLDTMDIAQKVYLPTVASTDQGQSNLQQETKFQFIEVSNVSLVDITPPTNDEILQNIVKMKAREMDK